MFGKETPNTSIFGNPVGIRTISRADAPITVNYTGPGITTQGGGGIGILALANNGGGGGSSGGVTVASSGPITTSGVEALGIVADSGTIYNATHSRPDLGPGGNVTVTSSGAITTQGAEAHGIWAASTTGTVLVNAFNNVSTTGQFSTGINAISNGVPAAGTPGGNVAVNVAQGVSVMGGWQADVTGGGSSTLFALPAAGVILNSTGGTATLTNNGSIGALSDRAVASSSLSSNNNTSIINNVGGTITGFVQLVGGNNSILNNGTFNLRHFADTNGDGGARYAPGGDSGSRRRPKQQLHQQRKHADAPASNWRHDAGQHGAVSPARQSQQRNGARRAVAGPHDRRDDVHQLGHDRSAKQPRRWRRAGNHRRAAGRDCRPRHVHLQWRHAEA